MDVYSILAGFHDSTNTNDHTDLLATTKNCERNEKPDIGNIHKKTQESILPEWKRTLMNKGSSIEQ